MAICRNLLISTLLFTGLLFCFNPQVSAQEASSDRVQILSPGSGTAVQGNVQIMIATDLEETRGGELVFTYAGAETETWFLIWESDQPVSPGELTVWDTTTLTDGNYDLRLVVHVPDGEQTTFSRNIRVRNYTAIETNTPAPIPVLDITATPSPSPLPEEIPTATLAAVPVALTNPASLSGTQVVRVLLYSAGGVFGIFLMIGMYSLIRSLLRSRR